MFVGLCHPFDELSQRTGGHVGYVIRAVGVQRLPDARHGDQRLGAIPVPWQIRLPGQVHHGTAQRGRQVLQQPATLKPALAGLQQ